MPAFPRQVNFAPTPVYSRPPNSAESDAFHAFARHAAHCRTCAHPYSVHISGNRLCDVGHAYAQRIAEYVYTSAGSVYSVLDREQGHQVVHVEIPVGCEVVRELLNAMERGLRIRRQAPVISYDSSYYVAPRPVVEPRIEVVAPRPRDSRPARGYRDARLEIIEPRRHDRPHIEIVEPRRKEKIHTSRRGPGYDAYLEERRRYYEESRHLPVREYYDPTVYR